MTERIIENQVITETQVIPDLLTGSDIGTWQAEYLLREVEFERIKHGKPITYNWANSIALTSFGFGLSLLAKGYSSASLITKGEWVALAFGIGISVVLYLIGIFLPDNRKKVMKKIESHFETAPTQRQILRGRE
ncbi:hypothetical protein Sbal625DRAFT_0804 [Shewanella baltica OS625]|uniref:Uncharacterized protein n=1 Tax=Shewanella baltica (strain OS195) TaxID=399599 RepID=A9KU36_SHEB9|nr:hypothetical protein [Shewanella baltica]ABX51417.1 hypothetical protein Sbal195_4259 [Shewanella baltica OS195]ADT96418.1 hypothetical protein Sbal678_4292 [Shewanella baltica OS678]EHC07251.1 hypothetical protein Sbal625DRAFT_0804 [Shewanella baltica OS625]